MGSRTVDDDCEWAASLRQPHPLIQRSREEHVQRGPNWAGRSNGASTRNFHGWTELRSLPSPAALSRNELSEASDLDDLLFSESRPHTSATYHRAAFHRTPSRLGHGPHDSWGPEIPLRAREAPFRGTFGFREHPPLQTARVGLSKVAKGPNGQSLLCFVPIYPAETESGHVCTTHVNIETAASQEEDGTAFYMQRESPLADGDDARRSELHDTTSPTLSYSGDVREGSSLRASSTMSTSPSFDAHNAWEHNWPVRNRKWSTDLHELSHAQLCSSGREINDVPQNASVGAGGTIYDSLDQWYRDDAPNWPLDGSSRNPGITQDPGQHHRPTSGSYTSFDANDIDADSCPFAFDPWRVPPSAPRLHSSGLSASPRTKNLPLNRQRCVSTLPDTSFLRDDLGRHGKTRDPSGGWNGLPQLTYTLLDQKASSTKERSRNYARDTSSPQHFRMRTTDEPPRAWRRPFSRTPYANSAGLPASARKEVCKRLQLPTLSTMTGSDGPDTVRALSRQRSTSSNRRLRHFKPNQPQCQNVPASSFSLKRLPPGADVKIQETKAIDGSIKRRLTLLKPPERD